MTPQATAQGLNARAPYWVQARLHTLHSQNLSQHLSLSQLIVPGEDYDCGSRLRM